jgi:hypothetical protein
MRSLQVDSCVNHGAPASYDAADRRKDPGGSGFPGGFGALQYTFSSHKPESSRRITDDIALVSEYGAIGASGTNWHSDPTRRDPDGMSRPAPALTGADASPVSSSRLCGTDGCAHA